MLRHVLTAPSQGGIASLLNAESRTTELKRLSCPGGTIVHFAAQFRSIDRKKTA
jgi:hypothetical protein